MIHPAVRLRRLFDGPLGFYGGGRIQQHLLEHGEIVDVAPASQYGNAAKGQQAVVLDAFRDRDELCLLEYLQMPVEISVRQRAELLQIAERQSFRMSNEGGEHAQACTFGN